MLLLGLIELVLDCIHILIPILRRNILEKALFEAEQAAFKFIFKKLD